jgi:hypothetical protein
MAAWTAWTMAVTIRSAFNARRDLNKNDRLKNRNKLTAKSDANKKRE